MHEERDLHYLARKNQMAVIVFFLWNYQEVGGEKEKHMVKMQTPSTNTPCIEKE